MKFALKKFTEGPYNGFSFNVPHFETVAEAVAHYSEDNVLKFINNGIVTLVRTKTKPPKFTDPIQQTTHMAELATKFPDACLLSETDALAFKPFERELTESGLLKAINEAKKAKGIAKAKGDAAAVAELDEQLAELFDKYMNL